MRQRWIACIIGTLFLFTSASAQAVDTEDEQIFPWTKIPANTSAVQFYTPSSMNYNPYIHAEFKKLCTSVDDPHCADMKWVQYSTYLGPCTTTSDTDCIENFSAKLPDGNIASSTLDVLQPQVPAPGFAADAARTLPAAHMPVVYDIAQAAHSTGNKYMVGVFISGRTDENGKGGKSSFGAFNRGILNFNVYAVSEEKDSKYQGSITQENEGYGVTGGGTGEQEGCALAEKGICWRTRTLPSDISYSVTVRLRVAPPGWLFGRTVDPQISVENVSGVGEKWSISAKAIKTAYIWGYASNDKLPPGHDAWLAAQPIRTIPVWDDKNPAILYRVHSPLGGPGGGDGSKETFDAFNHWIPIIGDKASANPSMWSFRTIQPQELNNIGPCFQSSNKLLGVVTTNSMLSMAGPPTFDKNSGSLDYQVASPHLMRTGDLFLGTYDLVMRSETARCLYNFSNAPVEASISVTNAEGTSVNATKIVNEKDGWLHLGAYGFTFSSPKIAVKLSQAPVVAPIPAPTSVKQVPQNAPAKKTMTSITCVKGKTKKIVTGAKPKCPVGYKVT